MGLYSGGLYAGGAGVGVGGGDIWNVDWVIYLGGDVREVKGGLYTGVLTGFYGIANTATLLFK